MRKRRFVPWRPGKSFLEVFGIEKNICKLGDKRCSRIFAVGTKARLQGAENEHKL